MRLFATSVLVFTCTLLVHGHDLIDPDMNCKNLDYADDFRVYWSVDDVAGEVTFVLSAKVEGWVALGLSDEGIMAPSDGYGADLIMGYIDDVGLPDINDYHSPERKLPELDAEQNVTMIAGEFEDGYTYVKYKRPLAAYGNDDRALILEEGGQKFIWALRDGSKPTDEATWSKHTSRGDTDIILAEASECIDATDLNVFTSPDGKYNLQWSIQGDNIDFRLEVESTGWAAFGLSPSGVMSGADMVVGWVSSDGEVYLTDRWSDSYLMPELDATSNLINVQGSESGTTTTLSWSRPLDTGDSEDFPITDADVNILWAYADQDGEPSDLSFPKHTQRGVATLNLYQGALTGLAEPRLLHGVLMLLAWPLAGLIGGLVARFMKPISDSWFKIHVGAELSTLILSVVGFVVILNGLSWEFRFTKLHHVLGYVVVFGGLIQGFVGYDAHRKYDPKRKAIPGYPDKSHWWLGRSLILIAVIEAYLGLEAYGSGQLVLVMYTIAAGWALLVSVGAEYFHRIAKDASATTSSTEGDAAASPKKSSTGHKVDASPASSALRTVLLAGGGSLAVLFVATTVLTLRGPASSSDAPDWCPECTVIDLVWEEYEIGYTESSSYACFDWDDSVYEFLEDKHIIRIDPLIREEDEEFVHHILLNVDDNFTPNPGTIVEDCAMPSGGSITYAWAVGVSSFLLPELSGFPVAPGSHFSMQVHFDNPALTPGVMTSSGMRIYLAPELREENAGLIFVNGRTANNTIPPGYPWSPNDGLRGAHASSWCAMEEETTVYAHIEHMHQAGRRMWVSFYEIPNFDLADFSGGSTSISVNHLGDLGGGLYSYDDQQFVPTPEPITMPPLQNGEAANVFFVHCEWETGDRTEDTAFGDETADEMCVLFLLASPLPQKQVGCTAIGDVTGASCHPPSVSTLDGPCNAEFGEVFTEFAP